MNGNIVEAQTECCLLFDVAVFLFRQNHHTLKQLQFMGGMKQRFHAMER